MSPEIKDSGERSEFASGMVRDTSAGKVNYLLIRNGPMFKRWAQHLTAGEVKYPAPSPGVANWTLAAGIEEYTRFRESAARHFESWLAGETDEDHAAGVFFNVNGAEYVKAQMSLEEPSEVTFDAADMVWPPSGLPIPDIAAKEEIRQMLVKKTRVHFPDRSVPDIAGRDIGTTPFGKPPVDVRGRGSNGTAHYDPDR